MCFYVDQAISPAKLICGKNEAWFFVFCPKSSLMNKNRVWWGWIFQNLPVPHRIKDKETMPSKSTNPLHPFIAGLKEKRPWFTISIQNGNVLQRWSFIYVAISDTEAMQSFGKVEETKNLWSFWVLQRKTDFPLFYEAFEKVDAFWGQNGTTHEINS